MTRDQLIAKLKQQRAKKIDLTWNQFVTAFQSLSPAEKGDFLASLNAMNFEVANRILMRVVRGAKESLAGAEVDAIVADDTITITELLGILE